MDARGSTPFQGHGNASPVVGRKKPLLPSTSLRCARWRGRIVFFEPFMTHQNGRPDAGRISPAPILARTGTLHLLAQGWNLLVLMLAIPRLVSYLGAPSFSLFS